MIYDISTIEKCNKTFYLLMNEIFDSEKHSNYQHITKLKNVIKENKEIILVRGYHYTLSHDINLYKRLGLLNLHKSLKNKETTINLLLSSFNIKLNFDENCNDIENIKIDDKIYNYNNKIKFNYYKLKKKI